MPGVCPGGGDVEASIWLIHNFYVRLFCSYIGYPVNGCSLTLPMHVVLVCGDSLAIIKRDTFSWSLSASYDIWYHKYLSCIGYRWPRHVNWSQLKMGPLWDIGKRPVWSGADPGEVKRVNSHPPFSEPPSFFLFFLSLKYWLVLIHYYKNSPPISKSWIRAWALSGRRVPLWFCRCQSTPFHKYRNNFWDV